MDRIIVFFQKETSRSVMTVAFGKMITVILGFLTIFLSAKGLSVSDFGSLAFFYVCVESLGLFSLPGINQVLNKAIHNKKSGFYRKGFKLSFLSALIPIVLLGGMVFLDRLSYVSFFISSKTLEIVFLGSLFVVFQSLEKHSDILPALKKFKALALFNIMASFLKFVSIGCVSYYYQDLRLSLLAFCAAQAILGLSSFLYCYYLLRASSEESDEQYVNESVRISLIALVNVLASRVDRVILYNFSPASLGWLQAGLSYPEKIREVLKTLMSVVLNSWLSTGKDEFIKRVKKYKYLIISLLFLGGVFLAGAAYFYIPLLFGPEYQGALHVAVLMGPIVALKLMNSSFANYTIVYGDISKYQKLMFLYQGLYLFLTLLLIWYYGYLGAAFAMLTSELILTLLYVYLFKIENEEQAYASDKNGQ
jgi:O-antigen/teichoic acid export membrane protein